jgi:hypothetical protein
MAFMDRNYRIQAFAPESADQSFAKRRSRSTLGPVFLARAFRSRSTPSRATAKRWNRDRESHGDNLALLQAPLGIAASSNPQSDDPSHCSAVASVDKWRSKWTRASFIVPAFGLPR